MHVGTSGWQYRDWRGTVYPAKLPQRRWLEHYVKMFDTVEVNATFYRLPQTTVVERWAQTLPADFLMTIKASRYLTHVKRLTDPAEPVARLLERVQPLRDRGLLGPVLLQLPPNMPAAAGALADTLERFPTDIRVAVEPRDPRWFTPRIRGVMEQHRAALVWADRGGRATSPLWRTSDWLYLRLHRGRRDWGYDDTDLQRWARRFADAPEAYIYANNDPGGAAVRDAIRMRTLVAGLANSA